MCFGVVVLGSGADSRERILETSSVQASGFIKSGGQDPWALELLPRDCEVQSFIRCGLGRSKDKGKFQKDFHMLKIHRIVEALLWSSLSFSL